MSLDQARDLTAEDCAAVLEAVPSRLLVLSPDLIMLQASDAYLQATAGPGTNCWAGICSKRSRTTRRWSVRMG